MLVFGRVNNFVSARVCVCLRAYLALSIYEIQWFWNVNNSSLWTFRTQQQQHSSHKIRLACVCVCIAVVIFSSSPFRIFSVRMSCVCNVYRHKIFLFLHFYFLCILAPRHFYKPFVFDWCYTYILSVARCYLPDRSHKSTRMPISTSIIYSFKVFKCAMCSGNS